MRTLRITLLASLAGWGVGVVAGTVGGFVLTWVHFGPGAVWLALTMGNFLASVALWAFVVAVAILPGSLFFVAPLVFRALERSFWHPLTAACVGGGSGIVGAVFWLLAGSLFTTPVNWSRPDDRLVLLALYLPSAALAGMATGCVAALMGRTHVGSRSTPLAPTGRELPPLVPYEY